MWIMSAISLLGSGAYLLRGAEKAGFVNLGRWSLTVQYAALGSSVVTSTIGTITGFDRLDKKVDEIELAKNQRLRDGLEQERNLILLKLAADVSIFAWAIFELATLTGVAIISPMLVGGALVTCCSLLMASMAYEFHLWGGWEKFQRKVDEFVLGFKL